MNIFEFAQKVKKENRIAQAEANPEIHPIFVQAEKMEPSPLARKPQPMKAMARAFIEGAGGAYGNIGELAKSITGMPKNTPHLLPGQRARLEAQRAAPEH